MKPRIDAINLIHLQMHSETPASKLKCDAHHYGYSELRELLDFIYESRPNDDELLLDRNKEDYCVNRHFPTFEELFPEPEEKEIDQGMVNKAKDILTNQVSEK